MVMNVQFGEYTRSHQMVHFKWMNFLVSGISQNIFKSVSLKRIKIEQIFQKDNDVPPPKKISHLDQSHPQTSQHLLGMSLVPDNSLSN